jgi:predicted transcriptional regulator
MVRPTAKRIRRRWFFQVIRDMLAVGSGTKTDIMYAGRVNSQQLKRYLTFLVSNGLMAEATPMGSRTEYTTTEHGKDALSKLQEIIGMLGVDELPA